MPDSSPDAAGRLLRALEFAILFVGAPTLYALDLIPISIIGLLCLMAVVCLTALLTDRQFDRGRLWNAANVRPRMKRMLSTFAVGALLMGLGLAAFRPDDLFQLMLRRPILWAAIMVLYPVFSVYPQELIFRTFLFHRYRDIFPSRRAKIVASAVAFGYGHVMFRSAIAVLLPFIGGIFFARTYDDTRSTVAASVEHALYGCFIFTIGLGKFFYMGTVRMAAAATGQGL